jgi:hypothetical protein
MTHLDGTRGFRFARVRANREQGACTDDCRPPYLKGT